MKPSLLKIFFFGCMIMTRVHVVMDRTSDYYFKTFFPPVRLGWSAGFEEIRAPHVKYICPNA